MRVGFILAGRQGLVKGAVLLTQNPLAKCGFAGLLGDLFWLIARVCLKARFCCAKSAKYHFAPLAAQYGLFRLTAEVVKSKSPVLFANSPVGRVIIGAPQKSGRFQL